MELIALFPSVRIFPSSTAGQVAIICCDRYLTKNPYSKLFKKEDALATASKAGKEEQFLQFYGVTGENDEDDEDDVDDIKDVYKLDDDHT
eukprot:gene2004-2279_t